jgi:tetratricopeptide (TPR) repeat protein
MGKTLLAGATKAMAIAFAAFFCTAATAPAQASHMTAELQQLAAGWDHAAYELHDTASQLAGLAALETDARAIAARYPDAIEPLAWRAIIVCTKADASEGLKALKFAEQAKKQFEVVTSKNPNPLNDGSAYAMLGALYDGVPGFPIGFGDKNKARKYLLAGLKQNPEGADTNYFYGLFLIGQKQYAPARKAFETALKASPRPGREIGDKGRRQDVQLALDKLAARFPAH